MPNSNARRASRRHVLKSGVAAASAMAVPTILVRGAHAAGERLRVGIIPAYSFGIYWLVQDQGFAPGVDMEFSVFPSGPPAIEAMVGGFVDVVTVGSIPPLSAMYRGIADFREISVCGDASGLFTVVSAPDIKTLADLEGRRVAVTPESNFEFFLDAVLKSNGLEDMPIERVYLEPIDGQSSLVAGTVDATVPLATSRDLIFDALPDANMLVDGSKLDLDSRPNILDVLMTTQQFMDSHEDMLTEFVAAFHGPGINMVRNENDAVVDRMVVWQTDLGRAGVTPADVRPILNGYFYFDTPEIKEFYGLGLLDRALRVQSEFLVRNGRIGGMPDIEALASDQIIKRI